MHVTSNSATLLTFADLKPLAPWLFPDLKVVADWHWVLFGLFVAVGGVFLWRGGREGQRMCCTLACQ